MRLLFLNSLFGRILDAKDAADRQPKQTPESSIASASENVSPTKSFASLSVPAPSAPLPALPPDSPAYSIHVITPEMLGDIEGESAFDEEDRAIDRECTKRVAINTSVGLFGASVPTWLLAHYYRYRLERVGRVRRRLMTAALAIGGGFCGLFLGKADALNLIINQPRTDSALRRDQIRYLMRQDPFAGAKLATTLNRGLYQKREEQRKVAEVVEKFGGGGIGGANSDAYRGVIENQLRAMGIPNAGPEGRQYGELTLLQPKTYKYKDGKGFDILI